MISAVLPAILHSVVVVGTDTFALDDVSRGVEVGAVRAEDERVSTLKIYVIYVNLYSQQNKQLWRLLVLNFPITCIYKQRLCAFFSYGIG